LEAAMGMCPRDDCVDLAEPAAAAARPAAGAPSPFRSILDREPRSDAIDDGDEPEYFRDLNIEPIVAAATAGRDEYRLRPFFCRRLVDEDDIAYRQEVMQDLHEARVSAPVGAFAARMQEMRSRLRGSEEAYYRWQKCAWLLDAAARYCAGVRELANALERAAPRSRGFRLLLDFLRDYIGSHEFGALKADAEQTRSALRLPRYCVEIRGLTVTVRRYEEEADYSAEIEATFTKFRQHEVKSYLIKILDGGINHVEAQIIESVAKLFPEAFNTLAQFCENHKDFRSPTIERFDREVQFYIAYLEYVGRFAQSGLRFCYPEVDRRAKNVHGTDVFDLALAAKLCGEGEPVVTNDFKLDGGERVLVVSGPNQGGKTTLSRTFGQMHHFASLGCPVPGSSARLFLCDRILTHFEKEEDIANLHGKLQDDLLRIRRILQTATPDSLVIMNEIFSSTALEDAVFLATQVMRQIVALDCLCVCVTFLDEVAGLGPSVVSMVSTVVPENPARRTFKLVRRPADGRAYAMAIAEKHRLDHGALRQRLAR
jgi:DNA mismatch repair protein MutS